MEERIQKLLSQAGIASRRAAEELIREGRVTVNGNVVSLGDKADPETDKISVDGERIRMDIERMYIMVNKPRGVVTTVKRQDQEDRKTILDIVREEEYLYPVGRLDADSEGLVLLTNDGELAERLTHPRYRHPKVYDVTVYGDISDAALDIWRRGVVLEDGRTQPVEIKVTEHGEGYTRFDVKMTEGRNRQIRRIAKLLGYPVRNLVRRELDVLKLGSLELGEYRHLTQEEVAALKVSAESVPMKGDKPRFKRVITEPVVLEGDEDEDAPERDDREQRPDRAALSDHGGEQRREQGGERRDDRGGDRPYGDRPRRDFGDRPRRPFGDRPRGNFGDRPYGDRPPRRDFGDRPPRPYGDRPPRPEGGGNRPYGDRPPRRDFGDRPPLPYGDRPPRRDFGDRPPRPEGGGDRPYGDRPPRRDFGDRPPRPYGDRPPRRDFGDRPPRPEGGGDRPYGDRPPRRDFEDRPRPEGGQGDNREDRPRRPYNGDRGENRGGYGGGQRSEGGEDRPRRSFGGGSRPSGGRPGGSRPGMGRPGGSRPGGRGGFGGGRGGGPRRGGSGGNRGGR